MKIDFNEISDWAEFEDLVADYFNEIKKLDSNQINDVIVEQSGKGPDGGRDILVSLLMNDTITTYERKWVVQCKFYDNLKKSNLDKINIPTLISEYQANGYLLIVKGTVSSGVTDTFEKLRNNNKNGTSFIIWNGNNFRQKLGLVGSLHQQYFPKYYAYSKELEVRLESLKTQL